MVKTENECVGCPAELGCLPNCRYKEVQRLYCDECGTEVEELYLFEENYNGEVKERQLCGECVLENFPTVRI